MPRPFYGYNIPIAMQSTYLRDYASKNNFRYSLPVTEISMPDSFSMLNGLLKNKSNDFNDLAMVSIFILPVFDYDKVKKIFKRKKLQNLNLHFALEANVINAVELLDWVEKEVPLMKLSKDFKEFKFTL